MANLESSLSRCQTSEVTGWARARRKLPSCTALEAYRVDGFVVCRVMGLYAGLQGHIGYHGDITIMENQMERTTDNLTEITI